MARKNNDRAPGRRVTRFNVWPVVQRELREGARRRVNRRLRSASAGLGTVALWLTINGSNRPVAVAGGWLLGSLNTFLLGLIFLVVPALTADCLARERREGTLGLLFLTPLSAGGIIAGKVLAQALRAFTLWLAVLPLLTIPFITGGIRWVDALSACSVEFCGAVLCLAAGLLASSLARERTVAFLLAYLLSALFWLLFTQVFLFVLFVTWRGFAGLKDVGIWAWGREGLPLFSGLLNLRGLAAWSSLASISARLGQIWLWLCWLSPAVVLLVCGATGLLASLRLSRSWQERGPSARRESLLARYCTPLFKQRFARRRGRVLDSNPVAWLQEYSWKARVSKWGLCLFFLLAEWGAAAFPREGRDFIFLLLLWVLAGCCTFEGISGFLEEKRSGSLELLLVTPLSSNKIILGRAWGLCKQWLPSALVLATLHVPWRWSEDPDWADNVAWVAIVVCGFFALPFFATYFALRVKHLVAAALLTWAALCVPVCFAASALQFVPVNAASGLLPPILLVFEALFVWLACRLLQHSLARRIYAF